MKTIDSDRLRNIKTAITSIAHGDFDVRIARTNEDDVIESISVLLNMMAQEMKETLSLYSEMHIKSARTDHLNMIFILDQNYKVLYVNSDVFVGLGYELKDLIKKSFSTLLSDSHIDIWRSIGSNIIFSQEYNRQHQLILRCKNKMERSYTCGITSVYDMNTDSQYVIINIFEAVIKSIMLEDKKKLQLEADTEDTVKKPPNVLLRSKDRRSLQLIYQYILKNLAKSLPHLEELAHDFAINEFKLKYGFKQLYGTSIFRFQQQERIKKARLLLENTNLPIHEIAKMCGYKNGSHFSKDFRKIYSVTPRSIRG